MKLFFNSAVSHPRGLTVQYVLPCLKGLTDMEDMLIARVKAYMQIRWTRGRQLSYHDHIVNFSQDIADIARCLPHLPDSVDIVIIRKDDIDLTQHVDFVVRQEKVKAVLQYKIAHDPNYNDLILDDEVLPQLPENGSVADHVPTCREGRQDGGSMPAGPDHTTWDDDEEGDHSYAGGVMDVRNEDRPEIEQLRFAAGDVVDSLRYDQTVVCVFRLLYVVTSGNMGSPT